MTNACHDIRGIPVSYSDSQAIADMERAHGFFLKFRGDPITAIDDVIHRHPDFILAYLFKAACLTQILETRVQEDLAKTVAAAERLKDRANSRELAHLRAVLAWVNGDIATAVIEWERALVEHPLDLLALQIIHLTHVLFGDVKGQRDVVAGVWSQWDASIEGFEYVLGFYAFGLEENGDFERAEQMARQSLTFQSDNPYAVHAIAHTMDMQGRYHDGVAFMSEDVGGWTDSDFAIHLWWHTALMHLDLQEFERVLEIYDVHLRGSLDPASRYEEFDATALLWRLKLLDIDIADRWNELANKWEPSATDTLYAFNNIHAMMAFVAASKTSARSNLLAANDKFAKTSSHLSAIAIRDVGLPFCHAINDFQEGRFSECVDRLVPARNKLDLLGGSYVQREVLICTMLEAAIRAGQFSRGAYIANERCELKPRSVQRWRDLARCLDGLGDVDGATAARAKTSAILANRASGCK